MRCSFCGHEATQVAKLIAGSGVYICDTCVGLCVGILAEDAPAVAPSLPEWSAMSDNELLERILFIAVSAANIGACLSDRVQELRERGVSWSRIGAALGITRQSAWERFSRAARADRKVD